MSKLVCWFAIALSIFGSSTRALSQAVLPDDVLVRSDGLESECVDAITNGAKPLARHVSSAMRKSWWACAKAMLEASANAGVDARNEFDLESRNILREINALKAVLESAKPIQSIPTSFQWAQSGSELFINAKFAHKLDAPATLDVAADNVTLTATSLTLRASKDSKRFTLDLDFYDEIDPEASTWSFASVGRLTFNIKKKGAPSAWPRLLKSKQKMANMHHWWELAEKYEEELESLHEEQAKEKKAQAKQKAASESQTTEVVVTDAKPAQEEPVSTPKEPTEEQKRIKAIEKDLKLAIQGLEDDMRSKKRNIDQQARLDKELVDQSFQKSKAKVEEEAEAKKKEVTASAASTQAEL